MVLYLKSAEDEGDEDEESESRSSEYESASSKSSESTTEVSVPLKGKVIFFVCYRDVGVFVGYTFWEKKKMSS